MEIKDYSDKSFIVTGDTKPWKHSLIDAGGKWNPNLKDGPAWIFPKSRKEDVERLIYEINGKQINQVVIYQTATPIIGRGVTVTENGVVSKWVVSFSGTGKTFIDRFSIKSLSDDKELEVILIRGEWKISSLFRDQKEHTVDL